MADVGTSALGLPHCAVDGLHVVVHGDGDGDDDAGAVVGPAGATTRSAWAQTWRAVTTVFFFAKTGGRVVE